MAGSTLVIVVFAGGVLAALLILTFSVVSYVRDDFQFWPPPVNKPWQYSAFWVLFRLLVASLSALCFLDYKGAIGVDSEPRWTDFVSWSLFVLGFGAAFYLTNFLGWRTAYSVAPEGLRTDGVFAYSRNPIYVVSIIGMIGFGVAIASWFVAVLLLLWCLFYLLAPWQ